MSAARVRADCRIQRAISTRVVGALSDGPDSLPMFSWEGIVGQRLLDPRDPALAWIALSFATNQRTWSRAHC